MKIIYFISFCFCLIAMSCNKAASDKLETETSSQQNDAWRSSAPGPGKARSIQLGESTSFELKNGLQVIVVENHKLPRISYQLSLAHDPLVEGDQAGYVSIAGTLLKTGTTTKSKSDIDEAIDFIGARLNTSGSGIFGSSLTKHQDKLLKLMTDVLYHPSFNQEEFEKIKKQTLSGLSTTKTDPNTMATNVSSALLYGTDHPYGEIQTEKSVSNIDLAKCKSYYDTYFKPNNAYLVVVGDITPADAKSKVHQYFSSWDKGDVPMIKYKKPTAPSERKVAIVHKDGAVQSVIRVTYPVDLKPGDDMIIASSVMNSILGGGIFSGRLMQNLREDKAYTYGARSQLNSNRLVGNFAAFASVRNEVTDSSVSEFLYEMERMSSELVSDEDLQLSKNSLAGGFARSLESPQTIARFALNTKRFNLPANYYNTYLERLEQVSLSDINIAAKKYITPDNAYVVIAGSKDDIADKLLTFDSDGVIDYYDAFGKEINYDDSALEDGITAETVIEDYISAIGGLDVLKTVKTREAHGSMDLMGQTAMIEVLQKAPSKLYFKIDMGGMILQEQIFDGNKVKVGQMGQSKVLTEGEEFDNAKDQSPLFAQMHYDANGYKLELKGIEPVDGVNAYKIILTSPTGKTKMQYYAVESNLLIREVEEQESQGRSMSITSDMSDYKEVNGVLLPFMITISGAMPMPMKMVFQSITINQSIDDSKFVVE